MGDEAMLERWSPFSGLPSFPANIDFVIFWFGSTSRRVSIPPQMNHLRSGPPSRLAIVAICILTCLSDLRAEDTSRFRELFNGRDLAGWVDVNTGADTWKFRDGVLVCTGKRIGVMRTEKQYENFLGF